MSSHPASCRALATLLACILAIGGWLVAAPGAPVIATNALHVTDCGDAGANTLRGQIEAGAGDTIVFDQNCIITLTTGTLPLTRNLTIDGTGYTVIVDGGCTFSGGACTGGGVTVFTVGSGVLAILTALTIRHGNAVAGGGIGVPASSQAFLTSITL